MPEKRTMERARKDQTGGQSATTQAGEFVREEMDHIREGKHGARNPQAGHRHRIVESEARGGEAGCRRRKAKPRKPRGRKRRRILRRGQTQPNAKPSAKRSQGHYQGVEAGRPFRGFSQGSFGAGEESRR